jgi:hypothetical protein
VLAAAAALEGVAEVTSVSYWLLWTTVVTGG